MNKKRASALVMSYVDFSYKHEPKHKLYVNKEQYKRILKLFYKKLAEELISSGKEIILPSRLGSLQAVKYKPIKKKIDHKRTKELYAEHNKRNPNNKKYVYHTNRATKGYLPFIYWSKLVKANFKNKRKYKFSLTRPNLRPNSYNKINPNVSLIPYFREKGYIFYETYNITLRRNKYEQLSQKRKHGTT